MHLDAPTSKTATATHFSGMLSSSMALSAPYDDGMSFGMGFNSLTQQPCLVGAVKQAARANATKLIVETLDSQGVTWTGKFVDKISAVMDCLNVSGSLPVQSDAGGKAPCFFDTNKFSESDVNYFMQVRVTKYRVLASDLEFDPIPDLPESDFTRVYGDTFISGFVHGGELNVLVSIKLGDRSTTDAVKQRLENVFNSNAFGSAVSDGSEDAIKIDGETTISVSWRSGGLEKPSCNWTLVGLKHAIQAFPERAMAHPMRISAILTKYTSLRSFYAHHRGVPLDYRNTQLPVSSLLDAYMDYKAISHEIQRAMSGVEDGHIMLTEKVETAEFTRLSLEAKRNYEAACRQAVQTPEADDERPAHPGTQSPPPYRPGDSAQSCEPPMPPNDLVPYKGSIFGLEKAQQDCQLEMTKIVREVNAIAQDPKTAGDPSRARRYLSPALFRALIPTVTDLRKQKAEEQAAEEAKEAHKKQANELAAAKGELEAVQRELEVSKQDLEDKANALMAFRTKFNPYDGWCPVELFQPIRIRAHASGKYMDYYQVINVFHQWDYVQNNPNQKFEIRRVGLKSFAIRHCKTGRYVTTGGIGDIRVYLVVGEFPTLFTFERLEGGAVRIHLAEHDEYTLCIEHGARGNGGKIVGWAGDMADADRWYVEPGTDFST